MIRQFLFATPEFEEALHLRDRLLRQPLNLVFHVNDIEQEYDSFHFGYFEANGQLAGCLTMVPVEKDQVKMRQVAVSELTQNKGIGKALVLASEKWARSMSYVAIVLHARDTAVGFYEKLGYQKQGKPFKEVGIKHFKMIKILENR